MAKLTKDKGWARELSTPGDAIGIPSGFIIMITSLEACNGIRWSCVVNEDDKTRVTDCLTELVRSYPELKEGEYGDWLKFLVERS